MHQKKIQVQTTRKFHQGKSVEITLFVTASRLVVTGTSTGMIKSYLKEIGIFWSMLLIGAGLLMASIFGTGLIFI